MNSYSHAILSLVAISASFIIIYLPRLRKKQRRDSTREKLRLIDEAIEAAEERAMKLQEREDRILAQVCSYYLVNQELVDALAAARAATKEVLEFARLLRKLKAEVLSSFPDGVN